LLGAEAGAAVAAGAVSSNVKSCVAPDDAGVAGGCSCVAGLVGESGASDFRSGVASALGACATGVAVAAGAGGCGRRRGSGDAFFSASAFALGFGSART
jgi:hypothetical protein